ncbi:SMODS domain-containing nucleotidyltransferase [Candidatus Poriferisodalis sp.]|uniref:SMODS domain-containing nucleotidyltransferase n=1 Tax=Candidatus Poriferisodalis sp. TaxID=3101277 RepID=UPI003AF5431F
MEHATYFETFLKNEVNLSQSSLDLLVERVDAVYDALKQDDTIGSLITGKIPQGSWPHRLIIKPKAGGDFDADFLLEMDQEQDWEPKTYPNEVYNALHRHSTYSKQGHGRKCRCVYLKYAPKNNIGCHLDIVPFVTLQDGRRVIVNRDDNEWEPPYGSTDPQAFSNWVYRRDEITEKHFRKVVRLMKFLRDERGSFSGVKSVVLTTVLGMQVTELRALSPDYCRNLPTALLNLVEDLDTWLQRNPTKPSLPNPSNDGTNFDHRWAQETYANFRDRIHSIAATMRDAYDETDKGKSVKTWQKLFGSKFSPPGSAAAKTAGAAVVAATISSPQRSRSQRSGRAG